MALRALTREPSDYVARFVKDGSVMVRQRTHIMTEGRIKVNEIYSVRWGTTIDTADAIIVSAGDYITMSARAMEAKKDPRFGLAPCSENPEPSASAESPDAITPPSSTCSSPAGPSPPPSKRLRTRAPTPNRPARTTPLSRPKVTRSRLRRPLTKSGKPAATVVRVVTPPGYYDDSPPASMPTMPTISRPQPSAIHRQGTESRNQTRDRPQPTPTLQAAAPATPTPSTLLTPTSPPFIPARPSNSLGPIHSAVSAIGSAMTSLQKSCDGINKKLDTALKRISDLEIGQTRLENKVDQILCRPVTAPIPDPLPDQDGNLNIPDAYHINNDELISFEQSTKGPGNFAARLTKRFFPELFGNDNLQFWYNWYGGGKHAKRELDPTRKEVIRRYTNQHHPEVRRDDIWRERVVPKINELLRRPAEKRNRVVLRNIENQPEVPQQAYSELGFDEL